MAIYIMKCIKLFGNLAQQPHSNPCLALGALVVAMVTSIPVHASYCNFEDQVGPEYEFGFVSAYNRFTNEADAKLASSYPLLQYEKGGAITQEFAYGRHLKILGTQYYKHSTVNPETRQQDVTRYYQGILDNCETIRVVVPEFKPEFARYFNPRDNRLDGAFNFDLEQNYFNMYSVAAVRKLKSHIGKPIYYGFTFEMPNAVTKLDIDDQFPLQAYHRYTLVDVLQQPLLLDGQEPSQITLELMDGKRVMLAPYLPRYVSYNDPLKSRYVNAKHVSAILAHQIVEGMTISEIILSLGRPDLVRNSDVVAKNAALGPYEKSDDFPYGGLSPEFPFGYDQLVGHYSYLYYPTLLGKYPVVVNTEGEYNSKDQYPQISSNLYLNHDAVSVKHAEQIFGIRP